MLQTKAPLTPSSVAILRFCSLSLAAAFVLGTVVESPAPFPVTYSSLTDWLAAGRHSLIPNGVERREDSGGPPRSSGARACGIRGAAEGTAFI